MVYHGDGKIRPWAGVTWVGTIGVYTGMNADGITMLMHDSDGLPASRSVGFTPRSLVLREALEAASRDTFASDVQDVFRKRRVMVGNNIHVSGPRRDGAPPAVVFEYDANERADGVTPRLPEHNPDALTDALWCTNHMCLRVAATQGRGRRYQHLRQRLKDMTASGEKLDVAGAMRLLYEVRQKVPTLHSVVCEPARHIIHVHIPVFSKEVVTFRLDDWAGAIADRGRTRKPEDAHGESAMTHAGRFQIETRGNTHVLDITQEVGGVLSDSAIQNGLLVVFVVGSTAAITTTEAEPGLMTHDLKAFYERIAPEREYYKHEETWHDDNGHAHVRASSLGPSLTVPIVDGRMPLGTWQQIILLDFDTRPRRREIIVQIVGE